MITLRCLPLRRPVVVSRNAPHFPGRGRHNPLRRPVARTISRCTCQKDTTNHRGGRRALLPAMPLLPLADDLTIPARVPAARPDWPNGHSAQLTASGRDGDHDVAALLAGLDVAVRLHDLVQWIPPVDDRPELPGL